MPCKQQLGPFASHCLTAALVIATRGTNCMTGAKRAPPASRPNLHEPRHHIFDSASHSQPGARPQDVAGESIGPPAAVRPGRRLIIIDWALGGAQPIRRLRTKEKPHCFFHTHRMDQSNWIESNTALASSHPSNTAVVVQPPHDDGLSLVFASF